MIKPPTLDEVRRFPKARLASFQAPVSFGGVEVLSTYVDPRSHDLYIDLTNRVAYVAKKGEEDAYGYGLIPFENLSAWKYEAPEVEAPKKKGEKEAPRAEA